MIWKSGELVDGKPQNHWRRHLVSRFRARSRVVCSFTSLNVASAPFQKKLHHLHVAIPTGFMKGRSTVTILSIYVDMSYRKYESSADLDIAVKGSSVQ